MRGLQLCAQLPMPCCKCTCVSCMQQPALALVLASPCICLADQLPVHNLQPSPSPCSSTILVAYKACEAHRLLLLQTVLPPSAWPAPSCYA